MYITDFNLFYNVIEMAIYLLQKELFFLYSVYAVHWIGLMSCFGRVHV
jgi:hypothetical protein